MRASLEDLFRRNDLSAQFSALLDAFNHRKHHRRSLRAVMHDYRSYHDRVVALVEQLSDADW